jgi:hypothetical protein
MGPGFFTASASFSRPADTTPYSAGDRVANATSGAAVLSFSNVFRTDSDGIRIERVRLRKTSALLTNAQFCVHLFRTLPTVSVNDNGQFNNANVLAVADITGYVGSFDITMARAATIGACGSGVPAPGSGITCESSGASGSDPSIWAVIEALAAYAGSASETFAVTLEGARG